MARKLSPPSPGSIAGKTSLPQPDDRIASISVGEYLSLVEVERYLQHKPPSLRDVALELRNLVATVAPQAAERILWKGLSYHDPGKGGPIKGGICQIEIHGDHVRLSFVHGAYLDDPESLLKGDRLAKRFVRLESFDSAPWDHLRELIVSSAAYDPSSQSTH
jgi:hypothetical protein